MSRKVNLLPKLSWFFFFVLILSFTLYVFYLNYQLKSRFSASRWSLPAKVYADNLVLYSGLNFTLTELEQQLKLSSYRKDKLASTQGSYSRHGNSLLISVRSFYLSTGNYQPAKLVKVIFSHKKSPLPLKKSNVLSIIDSKNNLRIKQLILDPALIAHYGEKYNEDRRVLTQKQLPDLLLKAIIATEDHNFYTHYGIDPVGILRALYSNIKAGKAVQGGSTITQQLVKNFFLSSEKSFKRKVNEALMALLLEYHYSKNEILTAYINEVYLGQDRQRAIHGFSLAAEYFFRRSLKQLSLPQIATLVGLVKGPSYYNPRKHPKRAFKRRNLVLKLMRDEGVISSTQYQKASRTVLGIRNFISHSRSYFPAFTQTVKAELLHQFSSKQLTTQGMHIYTTLKPWVQKKAEKQLKKKITALQLKQGKQTPLQTAMLISEVKNANIITLIGGKKPKQSIFNRAVDIRRTIGSLVKPAVYLTAFKLAYTPNSIIDDSPIKVKLENGKFWYPKNFGHKSHAKVKLITALSQSYNHATVRLGLTIGLDKVLQTLELLGAKEELPIYPSVLLGAVSMSPYQVNQLYQTMANKGIYQPLTTIKGVLDKDNGTLQGNRESKSLRFSQTNILMLDRVLHQVVITGTAKSIKKYLPKIDNLKAKTGTSNNNRDSWFVGYNNKYVATVWLGNDNNKSIKYTGATGAMLIWAKVMSDL